MASTAGRRQRPGRGTSGAPALGGGRRLGPPRCRRPAGCRRPRDRGDRWSRPDPTPGRAGLSTSRRPGEAGARAVRRSAASRARRHREAGGRGASAGSDAGPRPGVRLGDRGEPLIGPGVGAGGAVGPRFAIGLGLWCVVGPGFRPGFAIGPGFRPGFASGPGFGCWSGVGRGLGSRCVFGLGCDAVAPARPDVGRDQPVRIPTGGGASGSRPHLVDEGSGAVFLARTDYRIRLVDARAGGGDRAADHQSERPDRAGRAGRGRHLPAGRRAELGWRHLGAPRAGGRPARQRAAPRHRPPIGPAGSGGGLCRCRHRQPPRRPRAGSAPARRPGTVAGGTGRRRSADRRPCPGWCRRDRPGR